MSILLLSVTSLALAGTKVDVCHKGGLINISSSALPAHLGHGDNLPTTWYLDTDGDTYGDPLASSTACSQPTGTVSNDDDCDPDDPAVNPGATEVCNGFDDDCDGSSDGPDASDARVYYGDGDGDLFGNPADSELACTQPGGTSTNDDDCNDSNAAVNPSALETCSNGDDDCDGQSNEGDATDAGVWYADEDGDTYGDAMTSVSACEAPTGYVPDDSDCDDLEALSFPGNPELCDLVDNDCDLDIDEAAVDALPWYADDDEDGYGAASELVLECEEPPGYVADSQDCNDSDGSVSPVGEEVCDTVDNDCDAVVDEPYPSDAPTWYLDGDGDGYGDGDNAATACERPVDYVDDDLDCDDGDGTSSPVGVEVCEDGIDQDCSGGDEECAVEEFCATIGCDDFGDLVIGNISDGVTRNVNSAVFSFDGTFTQTASLPTVGTQGTPEVADLNADGYLDIVFANAVSSESYIYWGSADGYSVADRTSIPVSAAIDVVALDADHDGWLDLVFAEYSGPSKIYFGSATGYSTSNTQSLGYPITYGGYGSSYYAFQIEAADLDGDGISDVVLNGFHGVWAFPSSLGGSTVQALSWSAPSTGYVALADFNGDSKVDLAVGRVYLNQIDIYLGDGTGGFGPTVFQSIATSTYSGPVSAGDFDGDGDVDLITGANAGGILHYTTWNDTAGAFGSAASFTIDAEAAGASSVGDLDGDGYVDVALPLVDDGAIVYWGGPDGLTDADSTTLGGPNATYGTKIVTADTIVGQSEVEVCIAGTSTWVRGATAGTYLDAGAEWPGTWYVDDDGDGFGDPATRFTSCDTPVDAVDDATDCDDSDADSSPDGLEVCDDGIDQDCSGEDEQCADGPCFDDPSGRTHLWSGEGTAEDAVGTLDGAANGATYTTGLIGSAFSFDGEGDSIDMASAPSYSDGDSITVEFWMWADSDCDESQFATVLHLGRYLEVRRPDGRCDAIQTWFSKDGTGTDTLGLHNLPTSTFPIATDAWTHVALTFDGSGTGTYSIYLNGSWVESVSARVAGSNFSGCVQSGPDTMSIGNSLAHCGYGVAFDGLIDELSTYSRALTATEIAAIHDARATGECEPFTPLSGTGSPADAVLDIDGTGVALYLGLPVTNVGDTNGDGIGDILVGAHGSGSKRGAALLYESPFAADMDVNDYQAFFNGYGAGTYGDEAGYYASQHGDIDGDGLIDLAVGAARADLFAVDGGATYIISGENGYTGMGSVDLNTESYARIGSSTTYGYLGQGSAVGDQDDDGDNELFTTGTYGMLMIEDLSPGDFDSDNDRGPDDRWLTGVRAYQPVSNFDYNGDGFDDVTVGTAASYSTSAGGYTALRTGPIEDGDLNTTPSAGDGWTVGVAAGQIVASDLDDDGYDDVLFGGDATWSVSYLYAGNSGATATHSAHFQGNASSAFGATKAAVGDMDEDGSQDLAFGAHYDDTSGYERGAVYLFHGPFSGGYGVGDAAYTMLGDKHGNHLGTGLAAAGDATGDGHLDFWVGGHAYDEVLLVSGAGN